MNLKILIIILFIITIDGFILNSPLNYKKSSNKLLLNSNYGGNGGKIIYSGYGGGNNDDDDNDIIYLNLLLLNLYISKINYDLSKIKLNNFDLNYYNKK